MDMVMPLLTPLNVAYYLAVINFIAFAAFGLDKARAEGSARRVPESDLLFLAAIGGSPGAYAGRHLFRHKTRKQPFSTRLRDVVVFQVVLLIAAAAWRLFG
jgi:uncharacterized membrane protein YsdA (DUF1294 family)